MRELASSETPATLGELVAYRAMATRIWAYPRRVELPGQRAFGPPGRGPDAGRARRRVAALCWQVRDLAFAWNGQGLHKIRAVST